MQIERVTQAQAPRIRYYITSGYDGNTIAIEPQEAIELLTWLLKHKYRIVDDEILNEMHETRQESEADNGRS